MRLLRGKWVPGKGEFQHKGLWYPPGEQITKALAARLEHEEFYRADRFHDAMKHVRAWRGAVECGAHVGEWSRELAKRFERVVAIEMNPATAKCLQANLAAHPNATVVQCALGEITGKVHIVSRKGSIGGRAVALDSGGDDVILRRLDDLPEVAGLTAIDYLKVHVNGCELLVLSGAEQTIRAHRPVITVVIKPALADYDATPEDIFKFMERVGYRVASRLKPYWVFVPK